MGISGELTVQPLDLSDDGGGAVDRIRTISRVARVASPAVDRDARRYESPRAAMIVCKSVGSAVMHPRNAGPPRHPGAPRHRVRHHPRRRA